MYAAAAPQQFIALYFQVVDFLRKENNSPFAKLQAYPSTTRGKQFKLGRNSEDAALLQKHFVYLGRYNEISHFCQQFTLPPSG